MSAVSDNILVTVEKASKSYDGRPILREITFTLRRGERLGLMGPSGSGKSTLLNCLGGLDRLDSGRILLQGRDLTTLDEEDWAQTRRREIGTIFQFFHLLPTLTARENIEFPLRLLGCSRREIREATDRLLEEVGMVNRADARPDQLSGGEMQRVAIARALAARPRLLLADEPTGNLDSANGQAILQLLQKISARYEVSLVMVTHDAEATRICHRVLHLRDGRLLGVAAG